MFALLSRLFGQAAFQYWKQQRTTLLIIRMAATTGRPPDLSAYAVAELIRKYFPFKLVDECSVKQLESYDDRNFYFCGDLEQETLGDGNIPASREFVFKLSNPLLASYEVTEGLNVVMQRLNHKGFNCPLPLKGRTGSEIENITESQLKETHVQAVGSSVDGGERMFCARVLTFIPGELMDKVDELCLTPQLLYDVGNFIGRMDTALQDIQHPAVDARLLEWDLTHFLSLRKYLPSIEDQKKREMAEKVFKGFKEQVQPKISSMKHGTIHGDLNGMNIILRPQNGKYGMYGIIDFGDCRNESYVFELAIMLAYGMLMKENPIQFVCPMLRGYLQAFPLSEEELDCLYYSSMARCCQSAIIGEYQSKKEPWNLYLRMTPTHMWKIVEILLSTSKAEVDRIWTEACAGEL